MTATSISVSTVAYDGYDFDRACESLARIGATHVEPAFMANHGDPTAQEDLTAARASEVVASIACHGLACEAISLDLDLGAARGTSDVLRGMDFARRVGARVVNVMAPPRRRERAFLANLDEIVRHVEALGLSIGLENPGDGEECVLDSASDAASLLSLIGSPRFGLNYDVGNCVTHTPGLDPVQEAIDALPHCVHIHLKDVHRTPEGWFFTAIGQGDLDCRPLLDAIAARDCRLPVSIELPMRLHRRADTTVSRARYRIPLADIESALDASLRFVRAA